MSTASPTRSADFSLARPAGTCSVTGAPLLPDQPFMAALRETPAGFDRLDVTLDAWPAVPRDDVVAFWRTVMPKPNAKRKQFAIDDGALCDLLERLEGVESNDKRCFRFVLALILMRKRLVIYDGSRFEENAEIWSIRIRGREGAFNLVDPKPTEEQIAAVSGQLGEILNEEPA